MFDNFIVYDAAGSNAVAYATYFVTNHTLHIESLGKGDIHSGSESVTFLGHASPSQLAAYLKHYFNTEFVSDDKRNWL